MLYIKSVKYYFKYILSNKKTPIILKRMKGVFGAINHTIYRKIYPRAKPADQQE